MALVIREAQALESRLERELAAQCSNYQQLLLLKRKQKEDKAAASAATCDGMTRSERLIWYNANQAAVQLDRERCSQSSNYRQLQLARGVRGVEETMEEKAARPATRSEALLWYRNGGREAMEEDSAVLDNCGTWRQYHLMTRGRAEPRDADQEITRSERLHWYRYGGGEELVSDRSALCKESANWMQYKLTRDARQHAEDLTDSMNRHWSDFRSKGELGEHMAQARMEAFNERQEVREHVRRQTESRSSVARECYEARVEAVREEEAATGVARELSREERVEQLRRTTEQMLTSRTEYVESTRSMAQRAIREDAAAVAASRSVRRTTVVQQGA